MAKIVLTDVASLANTASAKAALNDNSAAIEAAMENTLSRDGTGPNAMAADLDMGEHTVLNVADPVAELDAVNKRSVSSLVDLRMSQIAQTIIEGTLRVDPFTATGGQQDFVLTDSPGTAANLWVMDQGIVMTPVTDYTLIGSDLKTLHFLTGRTAGAEIVARYVQLSPTDGLLRADLQNEAPTKGAALVMYKEAGTNTVARSISEILADGAILSVLSWIPKNLHAAIKNKTSTADLTTYIQQAITDVGVAGGGTIYFPRGLYNISATLDVPYNAVALLGAGSSGHYRVNDVEFTRASAATRIAWIGGAPVSGTPMIDFRTPNTSRTTGSGGMRDIMLDGAVVAKVGIALTSYNHGYFDNTHVIGCLEDGYLLRTADYTIPSSPAACQYNTFMNCKVTAHGGVGAWLTNECNGFRFTGPKYGTGGAVPSQSGDSSLNTLYSPVLHLAKGTMLMFEGAGQNVVYSPLGKAWAGSASGYDIIFGSADQDSNWPSPSGGQNIHPNAVPAKYNAVFWCEALVAAMSSQWVGGRPSWGNMVIGVSRGNNNDDVVIQNPRTGEQIAEIIYQTLGRSPSQNVKSRTYLNGRLDLVASDETPSYFPVMFLTKNSIVGNAGDGLAKIQWQFTNANGTDDKEGGTLYSTVVSATAGVETTRMSINPMVSGSQAQECMAWSNGVIVENSSAPVLTFQGYGTVNIDHAYYVDNLQVVGPRINGFATPSGTSTRTTFNTATVTTAQLAERFKALIEDLKTHGLFA